MAEIPLFYHPTSIVAVDDDTNLLQTIKGCLSTSGRILTFSRPNRAMQAIETNPGYYEKEKFINSVIDDENYEDIHHAPADFDITSLARIYKNTERFNEISILILDYDMPEKNGIDFSQQYSNKSFKKILLTGKAAESKVIDAFNAKLIDKYIEKGKENILGELNKCIFELTTSWFNEISLPIKAHLETNNPLPTTDQAFSTYFQAFCLNNNINEFYLIDKRGSYLCVNKEGKHIILLTHTDKSLNRWIELNQEKKTALLNTVRNREKIPFFGIGKEAWQTPETLWEKCLYTPKVIFGKEKYYTSIISYQENES